MSPAHALSWLRSVPPGLTLAGAPLPPGPGPLWRSNVDLASFCPLGRGGAARRTGLRSTSEDLPHGSAVAHGAFPPARDQGPVSGARVPFPSCPASPLQRVWRANSLRLIYSSLATDNVWHVSTCLLTIPWEKHLFELLARF